MAMIFDTQGGIFQPLNGTYQISEGEYNFFTLIMCQKEIYGNETPEAELPGMENPYQGVMNLTAAYIQKMSLSNPYLHLARWQIRKSQL